MTLVRRFRNRILLLAALIAAATAVSSFPGTPAAAQGRTNLVLAFYYAWYSPQSFGPGKTAFQPGEPYSSGDVSTIQRHVAEAKSAGIDGFVQSWYGPGEPVTNGNLQTLLDVAAASGFKAAIDFEPATALGSHDERASALQSLLATHATHPAYLRMDGKPVIFFWANWAYSVEDWAYIRSIADPGHNSIWIAEGARTEYLEVFDGLHLYNIAWSANPNSIASNWAANTRAAGDTYGGYKYWVATAMPGFDDRHLGRGEASVYRDRAGGAYYQNSFASAAASDPDLLIITSFNEWAEGSNIEPSTAFGNTYLDMTAQLISGYKSGGVAPPPPLPEATSELAPATEGSTPEESNAEVNALLAQDATATPAQEGTPLASPTPQADGRINYEVAEGDTLSAIAVRFGLSLQELYAMNDLDENSVLSVGQPILLGISDEAVDEEAGETLPPGVEVGPDDSLVYQVSENDTLIGIAVQHDLELEELLALNPSLTEDSLLQVGQDIVVGQRRQPASVGGSTDLPEGMATTEVTATETVTAPTMTPPPVMSPSAVAATPTEALAVVQATATPAVEGGENVDREIEGQELPPPSTGSRRVPAWLVAVGAFVFVTGLSGAVLFYLGSRQPK